MGPSALTTKLSCQLGSGIWRLWSIPVIQKLCLQFYAVNKLNMAYVSALTLTFLCFSAFSREEYVLLGLYSTALVSLLPGYNVLYSFRYFAIWRPAIFKFISLKVSLDFSAIHLLDKREFQHRRRRRQRKRHFSWRLKWISVFSNFVAFIPVRLKSLM